MLLLPREDRVGYELLKWQETSVHVEHLHRGSAAPVLNLSLGPVED